MNIYVIAEGQKGTKKLYRNWIPYVNSDLSCVDYIKDVQQNNVFVFFGRGQPEIWDRIQVAVDDVNTNEVFNRLVVAIDSEEMTFQDKLDEARSKLSQHKCRVEIRYIIQHFCLETWLLGISRVFRKKPRDADLIRYREIFDVRTENPELLPGETLNSWNRATFAYHYFRAGIRDTFGDGFKTRKSYTKHNPGFTVERDQFKQVLGRCNKRNHIQSFNTFLDAFI